MKIYNGFIVVASLVAITTMTTPSFGKTCNTTCRVKKLEEEVGKLKARLDHAQIRESDNNNICIAHNSPGKGVDTKDCSNGSDEYFVIGPK